MCIDKSIAALECHPSSIWIWLKLKIGICGLVFTITRSGEELRTVIVLNVRHCSVMPVAEVGSAAPWPLPDPWQYEGVRIWRMLYSAHHHHSYLLAHSTTSWYTHPLHHRTYPQHPANVTVTWERGQDYEIFFMTCMMGRMACWSSNE